MVELPSVLVTARSLDELTAGAREAIRLYLETIRADVLPISMVREIEVDCRRDAHDPWRQTVIVDRHRRAFLVPDPAERPQPVYYHESMLRYHVAFHLPRSSGEMVVAEALDFPGAVTQGFDLQDARLMIASALEDLAQLLLEDGKPLPPPSQEPNYADADLIELVPLSVHAGTMSR